MGFLRTHVFTAGTLLVLAAIAAGCQSLRLKAPLGPVDGGWPMEGRTMERKRWTPTPVRPPLIQQWTYDIAAGTGDWSPVVVDTIVFVTTLRGELFALNASSGKRLGKMSFGSPITGSPIPRRNLILVPLKGAGESLAAYDAVTGSVVWRGTYGDVEQTPLLIDRRIFFGTTAGTFVCVDRESGARVWTYAIPDNRWMKGVRGSPASDGSVVIFGADDGVVYALGAEDGQPRWTHATGAPVRGGIAVSDSTVVATNVDGTIVALDLRSGVERWRASLAPIRSSASIAGSTVVVGTSAGTVAAFDLASGASIWRAESGGPISASPTIAGEFVFVGTLQRELLAISLSGGEIVWREQVSGRIKSSAAAVNGMLYVTTDDQLLLAYRGSAL
jgi:outer membrane protein assembly factor BamB